MKWFQIITDNGKKKYILIDSIKWFGQEVFEVPDKSGNFKNFAKRLWARNEDGRHYLDSKYLLKDIRKHFPNYDVTTKKHIEHRKGKEKKAISRIYEVLIPGVMKVNDEDHKNIVKAITRGNLFVFKHETYYNITGCFFREVNSDEYVYYFPDKQYLYDTGLIVGSGLKKEHFEEFEKSIIGETK